MLLLRLTSSLGYGPHPSFITANDDAFHQDCMDGRTATDRRWQIGLHGGITQDQVKVIGAVHVSAGSWMPILQIDGYVI